MARIYVASSWRNQYNSYTDNRGWGTPAKMPYPESWKKEDEASIENSIDNLLSEDKGALYTHISRLNKKIEAKLGERGARPYKIQFRRKTEPGRYLVDVPFDNIRWEQRF